VLLPVPYYGAFDQDLGRRALVSVVPVHASSADGFQLHMANVVEAYNKAKKQGIRIRALLLASPNNPLGQCYPADLLRSLIAFTEAVDIHLVSDEIYMMSDYSADLGLPNTFVSVLSLPARNPDKVHAIWAFSKDFCVSGFRIGVLVTRSQPVYDAVCSLVCRPFLLDILLKSTTIQGSVRMRSGRNAAADGSYAPRQGLDQQVYQPEPRPHRVPVPPLQGQARGDGRPRRPSPCGLLHLGRHAAIPLCTDL